MAEQQTENLINYSHCKKFALQYANDHRLGWKPKQVSKQFLDDLNIKVRMLITGAIQKHPTKGKTIKELQ